jgi:hypothetical protein
VLPQGEVLEHEFVMPTECQRQSAADQDEQVQHATDRGWRRRRKSTRTSFGECQVRRGARTNRSFGADGLVER